MYTSRPLREDGMNCIELLGSVEVFEGVTTEDLDQLGKICTERAYKMGEVITQQGEPGEEFFIVCQGFVEVVHSASDGDLPPRTIVNLGSGQIFGEMALVDHGPRSATVLAASDETRVLVIHRGDFEELCEHNHHLGYVVMRNIAADLSFKVRHQHLISR
jgi:CRP/FNR family cyclic AMP-dependent transcriptional regulator